MDHRRTAHGAPLTVVDVVPTLSVHTRPIHTRSQQLHGSFVALVTHLVMNSCNDVRPKGAGQSQLLEDTTSLVCLSAIRTPSLRNKRTYCFTNVRIGRSLMSAAMTGPMISSCVCSSCRSAMDNLGRISVVSSALSADCTGLLVSPEISSQPGMSRQPIVHTTSHERWRLLVALPSQRRESNGMRESASAGFTLPGRYLISKLNCASCAAHLCSNAPNFAERR